MFHALPILRSLRSRCTKVAFIARLACFCYFLRASLVNNINNMKNWPHDGRSLDGRM